MSRMKSWPGRRDAVSVAVIRPSLKVKVEQIVPQGGNRPPAAPMWQIEREKTSRGGLHGGGFGPRSHDGTLRVPAIRAGLKAGLRAMIQERGAILLVSATLIAALAASSVLATVPLGAIAGAGVFCIVLLAVFPGEVPPGWTVSLAALI